MDLVVSHVRDAYEACNGTLTEKGIHYPTRTEVESMTESLSWGARFFRDQIQMEFDSQFRNTPFLSCFNQEVLPDWIGNYAYGIQ